MPKSSYFDFGISIYPQTGEYKIKHRKIMHIIKQCIEKIIHRSNPKYIWSKYDQTMIDSGYMFRNNFVIQQS